MTTTPTQVQTSPRHDGSHAVLTALLWVAVAATFLTALGFGWFQVSFQLMGDTADHGDYAMASGAYGLGAALLLFAPVAAYGLRLGLGSSFVATGAALVVLFLAIHSSDLAVTASSRTVADETWQEGAMFLGLLPWMWALPVAAFAGLLTQVGSRTWDSRSTSAT
jgi:hypothetical protein